MIEERQRKEDDNGVAGASSPTSIATLDIDPQSKIASQGRKLLPQGNAVMNDQAPDQASPSFFPFFQETTSAYTGATSWKANGIKSKNIRNMPSIPRYPSARRPVVDYLDMVGGDFEEASRKMASSTSTAIDTFSCLELERNGSTKTPATSFFPVADNVATMPTNHGAPSAIMIGSMHDKKPVASGSSISRSSVTQGAAGGAPFKSKISGTVAEPPLDSLISRAPTWLPPSKGTPPMAPGARRKMIPNIPSTFFPSKQSLLHKTASLRSFDSSNSPSYATGDELESMHEDEYSESYFDDEETCYTEAVSVATDPNVIAIGVIAPPSKQEEELEDQRSLSEMVARDLAETEHNLKISRNAEDVLQERRLSVPCIAGNKMYAAKQQARLSLNADADPRRSFLKGLHASNPTLMRQPSEAALDVPPIKPTSTRSIDSVSSEGAPPPLSMTAPAPRMRGRKSAVLANSPGMSPFLNRGEKVRAARASMGIDLIQTQIPPKSHSLSSCSPPTIPVRRNSGCHSTTYREDEVEEDWQEDDDVLSEGEGTTSVPSSSQSVVTNSSGVDLDDKIRNNIIARSASMHIARRRTILLNMSSVDGKKLLSPDSVRSRDSNASSVHSIEEFSALDDVAADLPANIAPMPPTLVTPSPTTTHRGRPCDDKQDARASRLSATRTASLPQGQRPCDDKVGYRSSGSIRQTNTTTITKATDREEKKLRTGGLRLAAGDARDQDGLPFGPVMTADVAITPQPTRETRDLEAQAGVPVVLPGAFAVRPLSLGDVAQVASGYDSGFEDNSVASAQDCAAPEAVSLEGDPAEEETDLRPIVSTSPVDAELYEIDVTEVQVVKPDVDRPKATSKRFRLFQVFLIFFLSAVVIGITLAVLYSGGASGKECKDNCVPEVQGWNQLGSLLRGPTDSDGIEYGFDLAISGDGNRLAIGLPGLDQGSGDSRRSQVGGVYILDWNGTDWMQSNEIHGLEVDGRAGTTVVISEDGRRIAFGAPGSEHGGYVAVYEEQVDGAWDTVGGIMGGDSLNGTSTFGSSLAFSADGTTIAVGDRYASIVDTGIDVGAIWVFQQSNDTWVTMGSEIMGANPDELFGWSLTMSSDGRRIASSAVGAEDLNGEVRVFDLEDDAWVQTGQSLFGTTDRETFGASIAFAKNGEIVAIGSTGFSKDGSGVGRVSTYQFQPAGLVWEAMGEPIDGDVQFDRFGSSVALSEDGDIMAIGSPENDAFGENAGFVTVVQFDGVGWSPVGSKLGQPDGGGGLFGSSVAISNSGQRVVGGAPKLTYDGKLSKVGQVWAYERNGFEGYTSDAREPGTRSPTTHDASSR